jgi:DNA-binding transcriptional ArsR family regulator
MLRMPRRNGPGIALLADETRRRIGALLAAGPMRPSALARELSLSRPSVSRQLALLHQARLVRRQTSTADRRDFLYSIEPEAKGRIIAWLAGTEVGLEARQSTIPTDGSAWSERPGTQGFREPHPALDRGW